MKTWHHSFNLELVPFIPIFEIVEKPSIKIISIKDFLTDNDFKSNLISKAIENCGKLNSDNSTNGHLNDIFNSESDEKESANIRCGELSKFLSVNLLNKVKIIFLFLD